MSQLVVDATLHEKLPGLTEPVELVDQDGNVIGQYVPRGVPDLDTEPSDDELDRLERFAQPRYTSEQVFAQLERLARENPS